MGVLFKEQISEVIKDGRLRTMLDANLASDLADALQVRLGDREYTPLSPAEQTKLRNFLNYLSMYLDSTHLHLDLGDGETHVFSAMGSLTIELNKHLFGIDLQPGESKDYTVRCCKCARGQEALLRVEAARYA